MKTIYIWMIILRERKKKYDNKKNDEFKTFLKSLFFKNAKFSCVSDMLR